MKNIKELEIRRESAAETLNQSRLKLKAYEAQFAKDLENFYKAEDEILEYHLNKKGVSLQDVIPNDCHCDESPDQECYVGKEEDPCVFCGKTRTEQLQKVKEFLKGNGDYTLKA